MKHLTIFNGVLLGLLCAGSQLQAAWQPPVVISDPSVGVAGVGSNTLIVNPLGNAIGVWTGFSFQHEFGPVIMSAYYDRASNSWTPSEVISGFIVNQFGPRDRQVGDADIAMNSSGYAVAVWEGLFNDDNFNDIVYATTRSPSGVWDPNVTPLSSTTDDLDDDNISISLNEAGTALASWRHRVHPRDAAHCAFSFLPLGGSWTPFVYSPAPIADGEGKSNPFINPSGNAVISWVGNPANGILSVEVAIYNVGTNSFAYTTLEASNDINEETRCSMDAAGNAVVVWGSSGLVKAAYYNGTSWELPVAIGTIGNNSPYVVMDLAGNATATWADNNVVKSSSRLPSGAWTTPVDLTPPGENGDTEVFQSTEQLAVNTTGDVIAIWSDRKFPTTSLFSNYKPFGRDWRPAELVSRRTDGVAGFNFDIGLADCGFAVAMWGNDDRGDGLIYANINDNLILPLDPVVARCCQKTASGRKCVNVLTWTPEACVIAYNIYCNDVLIATVINTGASLQFIDSNICRTCEYTISAITAFGVESEQVPFIIN